MAVALLLSFLVSHVPGSAAVVSYCEDSSDLSVVVWDDSLGTGGAAFAEVTCSLPTSYWAQLITARLDGAPYVSLVCKDSSYPNQWVSDSGPLHAEVTFPASYPATVTCWGWAHEADVTVDVAALVNLRMIGN